MLGVVEVWIARYMYNFDLQCMAAGLGYMLLVVLLYKLWTIVVLSKDNEGAGHIKTNHKFSCMMI